MKHYVPPKWIGCIPQGSHGSSSIQKKYWKLVSDYIRIHDTEKYGICISCLRKITYETCQAGHFKSWASCRGYSKWDIQNIFAQCAFCNTGFNSNEVGASFKENIIQRHGKDRFNYIENLSSYPSEKMEDFVIVDKMRAIVILMENLKQKPPYYEKIISNKEW